MGFTHIAEVLDDVLSNLCDDAEYNRSFAPIISVIHQMLDSNQSEFPRQCFGVRRNGKSRCNIYALNDRYWPKSKTKERLAQGFYTCSYHQDVEHLFQNVSSFMPY